jgi:lipoyl(octanoyl) transferase
MSIEIKRSTKPMDYKESIRILEERLDDIINKKSKELIWLLEHPHVYTAGTSYKETDLLDKSINLIKTNRGGKITYHGPGQIICYFVINLNNRKKDIRKLISILENTIIQTLREYKIKSFNDQKNIGIWIKKNNKIKKVAAIGVRVKKWIAYHGFSINVDNDLDCYIKIKPCGLQNNKITNLKRVKDQNYKDIKNKIIKNLINNLKI